MSDATITVTEVNRRIADLFKSDESLSDMRVKGEISNFTDHYKTGHLYFTLKDEGASVKAVMFKGAAASLRFKPENGMSVTARGDVRVFERDGQYQLYVFELTPEGRGALYLSFIELKERLQKEGLFSQKRALPRFPNRIAVITAETGAALRDILNIIGRRDPLVTVSVIPALVQGQNAPASLISALGKARALPNADLIIIGRGGGSIEDLQAFNDEGVARTLFASGVPTISAVGHETDFTICDFVADLRAPTPSAAAELAVPDTGEIIASLEALRSDLRTRVNRIFTDKHALLDSLKREVTAKSPSAMLDSYKKRFETAEIYVKNAVLAAIDAKKQRLISEMRRIDALSPINVLTRGYSIASIGGKPLTDSDNARIGDIIDIRLSKGGITAEVKEKHG